SFSGLRIGDRSMAGAFYRESRRAQRPAVRLQFSCAKRTSATAKESSTGPITSPRMPKAAAPPIAPTKIASVDTSTCCAVRSGRSTFSTIHSAAVQQARKIAAPQRPLKARYSTAGMSTALAPAGRKAAMVPSTPNTTGDGRPTSAKPAPTKSPWMSAVTAEPNTTARVTSRRYRMRRARPEPSTGADRASNDRVAGKPLEHLGERERAVPAQILDESRHLSDERPGEHRERRQNHKGRDGGEERGGQRAPAAKQSRESLLQRVQDEGEH